MNQKDENKNENEKIEINEKYINTTQFHKDNFRNYIDPRLKQISYYLVGVFGISSFLLSIVFYIIFPQGLSIGFLIGYFITMILVISLGKKHDIHRWNMKKYAIMFFIIAFLIQIYDIFVFIYILPNITLVEFTFLTLGNSWAPACFTVFFLYATRGYVNLVGRIHLLLYWIYNIGKTDISSNSIMKIGHLYFHNYLNELETYLNRRVKLVITNQYEILTSFYTKLLGSTNHFNIIVKENGVVFNNLFDELYSRREKDTYKNLPDLAYPLLKITKLMSGIDTIEIIYITLKMKIIKVLKKSIKYLVPAATSIASFLIKILVFTN